LKNEEVDEPIERLGVALLHINPNSIPSENERASEGSSDAF
jgi:hypothetical protein